VDAADSIKRELILPVPRERVWAALTEPQRLGAWFGTSASIDDLRPGGAVTFVWDGSTGPRGTQQCVIDVVEPPRRFAWRWRPFDHYQDVPLAEAPTTRVEFTLEEHPQGTRLLMVESGFASLPPALRDSVQRNARGWDGELAELVAYFASA
jgi:uncharacterized protein YndB with AHSA1/START domain